PMTIHIMNAEDRTGRGGDHIPFREQNYAAVRFTSTNEDGDANITPQYTDRQHSTRDILGKDINNDGTIDSFYVNLHYLKRNCMINANAAAMAALGPQMPASFQITNNGNGIDLALTPINGIHTYRIGLRTRSNDFDSIYTITNTTSFHTNNV